MGFSYETPKTNVAPETQPAGQSTATGFSTQKPNAPTPQNQASFQAQIANPNTASKPKSKVVAGLLAIFLGTLGVHKFYLGYTQAGIIMLLVSLLGAIILVGPLAMGVIALIEGILYLTKSDQDFYQIYIVGKRPWF